MPPAAARGAEGCGAGRDGAAAAEQAPHRVLAEDWLIDFDAEGPPEPIHVYTSAAGLLGDGAELRGRRTEVSEVPGCRVLGGLLSPAECARIVAAAEAMGFAHKRQPGPVLQLRAQTRSGSAAPSMAAALGVSAVDTQPGELRQNGVVEWVIHEQDAGELFRRAAPHLPEHDGDCAVGINAYWRVYRYHPGDAFLPHFDGSWTGAGVSASGELLLDAYGDRASRCSLVLYLCDDFEGGSTRFYIPQGPDCCADVDVRPGKRGAGLLFWHGDHPLSPLHEGAAVEQGTKYVVRTDVLYPRRDSG
eukprot:TRINITY_DN38210_c0_g1_i2.p1 TRINITY_DN38210_c0_g1~~TRINITY_DN38210_c0_g1_i2.p1  ORF type:complete len:334 (+),score=73.99 TRINITY_DN38210_c0_g1_i2:96-1004(+)